MVYTSVTMTNIIICIYMYLVHIYVHILRDSVCVNKIRPRAHKVGARTDAPGS